MSDIVSESTAEHYVWGGDCDGWHLLKTPGLSVIKERMPPSRAEVRHYHEHAHQFFYILSGQATLEVDGCIRKLKPHEAYSIPPKTPHKLTNEETQELIFILVSSPMSHGDRVVL